MYKNKKDHNTCWGLMCSRICIFNSNRVFLKKQRLTRSSIARTWTPEFIVPVLVGYVAFSFLYQSQIWTFTAELNQTSKFLLVCLSHPLLAYRTARTVWFWLMPLSMSGLVPLCLCLPLPPTPQAAQVFGHAKLRIEKVVKTSNFAKFSNSLFFC